MRVDLLHHTKYTVNLHQTTSLWGCTLMSQNVSSDMINVAIIEDDEENREEPRKTGHGLRNMKMRAERLGAKLEVKMEGGVAVGLVGKSLR